MVRQQRHHTLCFSDGTGGWRWALLAAASRRSLRASAQHQQHLTRIAGSEDTSARAAAHSQRHPRTSGENSGAIFFRNIMDAQARRGADGRSDGSAADSMGSLSLSKALINGDGRRQTW